MKILGRLISTLLLSCILMSGNSQNELNVQKTISQPSEIKKHLTNNGFFVWAPMDFNSNLYEDSITLSDGTKTTLNYQLNVNQSAASKYGLSYNYIVTDNTTYFDKDKYQNHLKTFNSQDLDKVTWYHIWENPNSNQMDTILFKIKEFTMEDMRRNHPISKIDTITRYCSMENAEVYPKGAYTKTYEYKSILEWEEGMKFIVGSDNPKSSIKHFLNLYGQPDSKFMISDLAGDTLIFKRHEERENQKEWQSKPSTALIFTNGIKEFEYLYKGYGNVNGLLYLADFKRAKKELTGKTLYLLVEKAYEYDINGSPVIFAFRRDKRPQIVRHSKVNIQKLEQCSFGSGIKIFFKVENNPHTFYRYISLSGINQGDEQSNSRNFDNTFSFEHPKQIYNIEDEDWDKIVNKNIEKGMTKLQVRLSLGSPFGALKFLDCNFEKWDYGRMQLLFQENKLIVID